VVPHLERADLALRRLIEIKRMKLMRLSINTTAGALPVTRLERSSGWVSLKLHELVWWPFRSSWA